MLREDGGQRCNDTGLVLHSKPKIVRRLVGRDGKGLVLAQTLVGKRADTLRAPVSNLARYPHQITDDRNSGRLWACPAAIVKGVLTVSAAHPNRVVRARHMGQDGRLRNQ